MMLSSLREWLWRGRALRSARSQQTSGSWLSLRQRAQVAFEVGKQALDPSSGPWAAGDASPIAAGLFVESIGWSLRTLSNEASDATTEPTPTFATSAGPAELSELLAKHEPLLLELAPGSSALDRLRRYLLERDFESTALGAGDAEPAARELAQLASRLLELVRPWRSSVDRVLLERTWRSGGVALLLLGLLGAFFLIRSASENRSDLSAGKPWQASSAYEVVCTSPARNCNSTKDYFFHTLEESNPWLELDLMRPTSIGGVIVQNRSVCCLERAIPLVVEVSTDHRNWREVVRRDTLFDTWRASFAPATARWIRFRVAGRTFLHLQDVKILP